MQQDHGLSEHFFFCSVTILIFIPFDSLVCAINEQAVKATQVVAATDEQEVTSLCSISNPKDTSTEETDMPKSLE